MLRCDNCGHYKVESKLNKKAKKFGKYYLIGLILSPFLIGIPILIYAAIISLDFAVSSWLNALFKREKYYCQNCHKEFGYKEAKLLAKPIK